MFMKKAMAIIMAVIMTAAFFPVNAFASPSATPPPYTDETPGAQRVPVASDAAGGYMNVAYIYNGNVSNMDFSVITAVNYAFGLVYNTEWQRLGNNRESWNTTNANPALEDTVYLSSSVISGLQSVVNIRNTNYPDMKILLSIGGDGARGFSHAAGTPATRAKFIQSCLNIINTYGLDGIDLDWEFPCMDGWGQGLENGPADRDNFTALVSELKEAMGPGKLITMAGSADMPFTTEWVDIPALGDLLDWINLMTYDFQYGTSYFGTNLSSSRLWGTEIPGEQDNSVLFSVQHYITAGFPRYKINIGYTTGTQTLPEELRADPEKQWNWINKALTASGWTSSTYGALAWERVANRLDGQRFSGTASGVTKEIEFHSEWDRLAALGTVYAYDLTDDPGKETKLFVLSYLNADAMAARAEYIKGTGLAGSFFWQYGGDTNSFLARTMATELRKPSPSAPTNYVNLAYVYNANAATLNSIDVNAITHINCAFGLVYNTEWQRLGNSRESWNTTDTNPALEDTVYLSGSTITELQNTVAQKSRNPALKVLLSIGGDGARGFSHVASTDGTRAKFVQSFKNIMQTYGLDGIDLDWEGPSMDGWGHGLECSAADRENYTLLCKDLREGLPEGALLTMAGIADIPAPAEWTDMGEASQYLDFINLMTYDYNYGSSYYQYNLGSPRMFPAGLIDDDNSADWAVYSYVSAGVPRDKINIGYETGSPALSSDFRSVCPDAPSTQEWAWVNNAQSSIGWNVTSNGALTWQRVMNGLDGKVANGTSGNVTRSYEFHAVFERYAGVATVYAYDLTTDPDRTTPLFYMSYHDPAGLAARSQYIAQNGLGGSFYWSFSTSTQWEAQTISKDLGAYKPELLAAMTSFEGLSESDWTPETYAVAEEAYINADTAFSNVTISKADVDAATAALNAGIAALEAAAASYTVTFDPNGGSVSPTAMQTGPEGKLASLPTPTISGSYSFGGWFTAGSGGTQITTDTVFSADTTVYAHWASAGTAPTWPEGSRLTATATTSSAITLTWTAAQDDTEVTEYAVYNGNTLVTTTAGITLTYEVTGLTANTEYTFKVEAGDAAGNWSEDGPSVTTTTEPVTTYIVTFNNNGSVYTKKAVRAGESIGDAWPADPTRSGYSFGGWFTGENGAGTQFTPATPVNAAMTVYAKWTRNTSAPPTQTTPSIPKTPTYNADVKTDNGNATALPVTVDKNAGTASIDAGSQKLTPGGTVITIPSIPDINAYSIGITVPELTKADVQGTLTFNTGNGSVTVPSNMLTGIAGISGSKAEISIGEGEKTDLPADVKAAIGDRPLVRLTLSIDGKQTDWSNPDAPVTVSIPYAPTASELANPESIVIWYVDGSGNLVSVPNGHYDPATGTVTVNVTHFSYYAVGYKQVNFIDVSSNAWYNKAVSFIAARDITGGTGNGKYSPDAKLTRGEFIVLLMKAYGISPDTNPANNFSDAGSTYYTGYLAAAKRLGISGGIGNNMFAPGKEITRQEMFTLLYNALETIGQLPAAGDGTVVPSGKTLSDFTDAGQVDSWAQDAMTLLVRTGAVSGISGKLTPTGTTTRAEMAQVLYSLLSK